MNWTLKKVNVNQLKEWEKNPRQLTKKGIEDLTKSIKKFGNAVMPKMMFHIAKHIKETVLV